MKTWIGKRVDFEGPEGEGSIEYTGTITKEEGEKVYVSGHSDIEGWILKSALEVDD